MLFPRKLRRKLQRVKVGHHFGTRTSIKRHGIQCRVDHLMSAVPDVPDVPVIQDGHVVPDVPDMSDALDEVEVEKTSSEYVLNLFSTILIALNLL